MTEHPGIYIGLSEPFKAAKITRKEQCNLRNHREAFKASAKKYLADAYGVPADSLSVHIKSNGVDAFPIKMQSVHDFLNQTVTENAKEWENDAAAYQDIRHILDAIQKDVENAYKAQEQTRGRALDAYRAKEAARRRWLMDYRQFEKYRLTIPNATPKTFATFQKHKAADDEKYKNWQKLYREANAGQSA